MPSLIEETLKLQIESFKLWKALAENEVNVEVVTGLQGDIPVVKDLQLRSTSVEKSHELRVDVEKKVRWTERVFICQALNMFCGSAV